MFYTVLYWSCQRQQVLKDINPAEVRQSITLIVCVSFCLLAGRHFFIFGGENYAQRKGS